MRLDARAFGMAGGIVAALLFTICGIAMAIAPEPMLGLAGYLNHMETPVIPQSLDFSRFVGGLALWTLASAAIFAGIAAIYNQLVGRVGARQESAAGRPLMQGAQL